MSHAAAPFLPVVAQRARPCAAAFTASSRVHGLQPAARSLRTCRRQRARREYHGRS